MATAVEVGNFIQTIAPLVQKHCKQYGYKFASPIIAQACCESGYGTSWISKAPYFNFFGLKCGGAWKGRSVSAKTKEEYTPGVLTSIVDNFRAFDSFEAGVEGYFKFINWSRYANLKEATSPEDYVEKIKADGYATSSSYVSTLKKIIDGYNLKKYDDFEYVDGVTPMPKKKADMDIVNKVMMGKYGNNPERKQRLAEAGYDAADVQDKINKIYTLFKEG